MCDARLGVTQSEFLSIRDTQNCAVLCADPPRPRRQHLVFLHSAGIYGERRIRSQSRVVLCCAPRRLLLTCVVFSSSGGGGGPSDVTAAAIQAGVSSCCDQSDSSSRAGNITLIVLQLKHIQQSNIYHKQQ